MTSHGIILILAALALFAIHIFRPLGLRREQTYIAISGAVAGFTVVVVVTSLVVWNFDLVRGTEIDADLARFAADPADTRREILIIGSSHTYDAIDDQRLEAALARAGFPYAVRALTAGGFYAFEHDVILDEYLRETDRVPIAVMLEVATEYKIAIDPNKENKAAGIRYIDVSRAKLGINHVLSADWPLGVKVSSIWTYARHAVIRTLNTGLAGQAVVRGRVLPENGFAGIDRPHPAFSPEYAESVSQGDVFAIAKITKIPDATIKWRTQQSIKLPRAGVPHAIFFTPPILNINRRALQKAVCQRTPDINCIDSTGDDLMKELTYEHWHDDGHVLRSGAWIYTDWLANQLIQRLGQAVR
jgi:hypothetical protein